MAETIKCPECGSDCRDGNTCWDYFYTLLYWENEFPAYGVVHHLMVLSYYLQHPSLYSPEGLKGARQLLTDFLHNGLSPAEVRRRDRAKLNANQRTWKIKATPTACGAYPDPVSWSMVVTDVVDGGADRYCDTVRAWARSIDTDLKASHHPFE